VSGVYRQCPDFTGSVQNLQALSGVYRQFLEFTLYRQRPKTTGSVQI
jgi:hypothetical protein